MSETGTMKAVSGATQVLLSNFANHWLRNIRLSTKVHISSSSVEFAIIDTDRFAWIIEPFKVNTF